MENMSLEGLDFQDGQDIQDLQDRAALLAALQQSGAWQEGHFRLTSGRHSDEFFLMSLLFQRPERGAAAGAMLARKLASFEATTVIGPAMGGVLLAYETARHLKARALYTEKEPREGGTVTTMALRRGFVLNPGERVVMVEDVLTTGGSLRAAIEAVAGAGGQVVGAGVLVDRSGGGADVGVPLQAVWRTKARDWAPEQCELCRQGVPLTLPKAGPA